MQLLSYPPLSPDPSTIPPPKTIARDLPEGIYYVVNRRPGDPVFLLRIASRAADGVVAIFGNGSFNTDLGRSYECRFERVPRIVVSNID